MKKVFVFSSLLVALATSCKTDVDITADWENIPVIYCVIDTADAEHYVRIQRAFLGNANAYDMAQVGDSLIYKDTLDVKIKVLDKDSRWISTLNFQKILADKDSLNPQGQSLFGREGHHVYRSQQRIPYAQGYSYQIEVNFPDGKKAQSRINAIENFRHRNPAVGTKYTLEPNKSFGPSFWAPANAGAAKIIMHFHYYEFTAPYVWERKTITIPMSPVRVNPNRENSVSLKTNDIINRFLETIPVNDGIMRFLGKVDFEYYIADRTFADHLFKRTAGISGESNPISNIDGAYGIFAMRLYKRYNGFLSDRASREAFYNHSELRIRGFQPRLRYTEEGYKIDSLP